MNKIKTIEPQIDFGYHAMIPRVIRTGYKTLTPTQKWLYVCLRDLCGKGVCFRKLEVLSEETGISEAMLSISIRKLKDEGLITAEKKQRSTGGKGVWHITIIDIWGANAKAHPTKRSAKESSQSEDTQENVHHMNENVHHMNETPQENSYGEREYSQNADRSNTIRSNTIIEEREGEEDSIAATSFSQSEEPYVDIPQPKNDEEKRVVAQAIQILGLPTSALLQTFFLTTFREHKDTFSLVLEAQETKSFFERKLAGRRDYDENWVFNNLQMKLRTHLNDTTRSGRTVIKDPSISERLQAQHPDFPVKTQTELLMMEPEERLAYCRAFEVYNAQKNGTMQA